MKQIRTVKVLPLLVLVVLLHQCTNNPVEVSGGASGTEISSCTIKGKILELDWCKDEHAEIRIRPYYYLTSSEQPVRDPRRRGDLIDLKSSRNGEFSVDSMKPGIYMIEITNCGFGYTELCTVTVNDSVKVLDTCELTMMSYIKGFIVNRDIPGNLYVEVFGMDNNVKVDQSGKFQIPVPAGNYHLRIYSEQPGIVDVSLQVRVEPGSLVDLGAIDVNRDRGGPRPRP